MRRLKQLLSLVLALVMIGSVLTACGEPKTEDDMDRGVDEDGYYHVLYQKDAVYTVSFTADKLMLENEGDTAPDLSDLTKDDVTVTWDKVIVSETEATSDEAVEPTYENHTATVTDFKNDNGSITVTFSDEEAAKENTLYYALIVKDQAVLLIAADPAEPTITPDVEEVYSTSDSNEITLSLDEGSFEADASADDFKLGDSFEDMTVEKVSVNGSYMTLTLKGSPKLDEEISTTYIDGRITLGSGALQNTPYSNDVYIPVTAPMAGVDLSEMEVTDTAVTFPIEVQGMDADSITKDDIAYDGEGTVTDVKVEGDKVLVTVEAPDGDTDAISGDLTVGDTSLMVGVTHAAVQTVFDFIEMDGDDLLITLNVSTLSGTFSDKFGEDSFTLEMDYEGGSVESIDKIDDTHADVVIRFPRGEMTDEDYGVLGQFTLKEGALLDENGSPAPACTYARQYVPEEMGKDASDGSFEIDGLVINKTTQQCFKAAAGYGSSLYKVISNAVSGKWGLAFSGASDFLKLVGLMGGENEGVTNEQLMKEIKTTQQMISDMTDKLDKNIKQTYQNRLTDFETNIGVLNTDCELIEAKLMLAQLALEEQGIHNYMEKEITVQKEVDAYDLVWDGTYIWAFGTKMKNLVFQKVGTKMADVGEIIQVPLDDERASEYMTKLIAYCEEQEKAGNADFKNFTKTMDELEAMFKKVAVEAAKEGGSSPFYAFDSYWDQYFNFRSQSYFLRGSYYANCDTQLKRAYNLLATYYNIPAHQESYKALTDAFNTSIKAIESRNLGMDPSSTKWYGDDGTERRDGTYSPTLKKNIGYIRVNSGSPVYASEKDRYIVDDLNMQAYLERLHGKSIKDDLISAGIVRKDTKYYMYPYNGYGLYDELTNTLGIAVDLSGPYNTSWKRFLVEHHKGYRVTYRDWQGNRKGECYYDSDTDDADNNFDYWCYFYSWI